MECILSAAISGVLFALFSGQPLNILGSTGPMLVMEEILYNMCKYVVLIQYKITVCAFLWTAPKYLREYRPYVGDEGNPIQHVQVCGIDTI